VLILGAGRCTTVELALSPLKWPLQNKLGELHLKGGAVNPWVVGSIPSGLLVRTLHWWVRTNIGLTQPTPPGHNFLVVNVVAVSDVFKGGEVVWMRTGWGGRPAILRIAHRGCTHDWIVGVCPLGSLGGTTWGPGTPGTVWIPKYWVIKQTNTHTNTRRHHGPMMTLIEFVSTNMGQDFSVPNKPMIATVSLRVIPSRNIPRT